MDAAAADLSRRVLDAAPGCAADIGRARPPGGGRGIAVCRPARTELDAFASFGAAVGASRALWLWRTYAVSDGAGGLRVDRTEEAGHASFQAHAPAGLPEQLEVWLIHEDGTRELGASLALDLAGIAADLDLAAFNDEALLASGELPDTWWLSYRRAVEVGLGVDLDVGAVAPELDALVVLGVGQTAAAEVVDLHNRGGRLAVLAPGTPTNTVAGEPTTDFGDHADSLFPLLHVDAAAQHSTPVVLTALTGRVAPAALPVLGGDLDYFGPGGLAVQGLWPVLWGRALRDVTGAGEHDLDMARWARYYLAVEGPRPAIRIGEQPYGLLPTSAFESWIDAPGDVWPKSRAGSGDGASTGEPARRLQPGRPALESTEPTRPACWMSLACTHRTATGEFGRSPTSSSSRPRGPLPECRDCRPAGTG